MSVITIERKIESAKKKSELLSKEDKMTWQEEVDSLLDRMNLLNKVLSSFHELVLKLTFEIERDFEGFKQSKVAPEGIKIINVAVSKVLILVRKSDLYPGVKSTFHTLKAENNYLKDLLSDRIVSKEMDEDAEMLKIVNSTLASVAKSKKK